MTSKTVALLLLGLVLPGVASAQSPKAGTWTGSAVPPGEGEFALTYDVTVSGDSLGIVVHAGDHGDFAAQGGHYADKTITFTLEAGALLHCVLNEDAEGAYAGNCLADDGAVATMKMVPPTLRSAQAIKPGKWTGSSVSPDGNVQPLTFDVTVDGDSLGIVIHTGDHGDFSITEGRYTEKTISFTFTPRTEFHCTLTLNAEGEYAGDCKDTDGKVGQMTMVPPKE